jgi:hypothetical protein
MSNRTKLTSLHTFGFEGDQECQRFIDALENTVPSVTDVRSGYIFVLPHILRMHLLRENLIVKFKCGSDLYIEKINKDGGRYSQVYQTVSTAWKEYRKSE